MIFQFVGHIPFAECITMSMTSRFTFSLSSSPTLSLTSNSIISACLHLSSLTTKGTCNINYSHNLALFPLTNFINPEKKGFGKVEDRELSMKSKGKKEEVMNKEEISESYCFVCKEGGDLLICDHRDCLKCFHPVCVGKDDSFIESDDKWVCDRHTCFRCGKSAYLYCYTCKKSVCSRCFPAADILRIKGKYGFCDVCLKLVLLIEENRDYDSDGAKVDFTDLGSVEGLFAEYYHIMKEENEFELKDLYAAKKEKKHQSASGWEEDEEEDEEYEDQISDYDGTEIESKCKKMQKKKRNRSAIQTSVKSNKKEFIGWASRSLVEFLTSIGKSAKEKVSKYDVASIVNDYVKENKLLNPNKRKMITCDAQLYSLFRRRTISKNRVYELLEPHFFENYDESDEDELGYDPEDGNEGIPKVCKRQRKLETENESPKMDVEDNVNQSCLASIVAENIKLIYLKRSLLHELLKQPKTFEEKVIGCFVRAKSDPRDISTRNSHQLRQVEGVKRVSNVENNMEVVLLFSNMPKEISINLLADCDFLKEECDELRQKMVDGLLKRPTVGDLQQKANILHEDITKHWINRELGLLQRYIDRANDKGWRRELHELLEKKRRLETPSEQSKLLENVPKVIPDVCELNSNSGDIDIKSDKGSPQSILPCNSSVPNTGWKEDRASDVKIRHGDAVTEPAQHGHSPDSELEHDNITNTKHLQLTANQPKDTKLEREESEEMCFQETKNGQMASKTDEIELLESDDGNGKFDDVESDRWCIRGPCGEQPDKCSLFLLRKWSEKSSYTSKFKVWRDDESEENAIWLQEALSIAFPEKSKEVV